MKVPLLWFTWLASFGLYGATSQSDHKQLRSLLSLPKITFQCGVGVSTREGVVLIGDQPAPAEEIPVLQAKLTGEPGDAPRYLQLARIYEKIGEAKLSSNAWFKSVSLGRKRIDIQPENAAAVQHLAEALAFDGQDREADSLFRRAVSLEPGRWQGHAALGKFLCNRAGSSLFHDGERSDALSDMLVFLGQHRLEASQVTQCQDLLSEAASCLNQAVDLAPDDADARMARIEFRGLAELFKLYLRVGQGEKWNPTAMFNAVAPITVLPDIRRAIELRPGDPRLAAIGAYYELFIVAGNHGLGSIGDLIEGRFYQSLSDSEQQVLRNKLHHLEEIADGAVTTNVAAALQYLGSLQCVIMRDYSGSEANLKRAVAIDPKRQGAWDALLASVISREGSDEELLSLAELCAKARPSSRNQVILAKVCEKSGRLDRALVAAERAVGADTNSFLAHHTFAVLLVLSSKSDEQLLRARRPLLAAAQLVTANMPAEDKACFLVNAACYNGLVGDLAEAQKLVKQARQIAPDDKDAEAAEKILQRMSGRE